MKRCDNCNCGREFSDEMLYCTECGGQLTALSDAEPVPPLEENTTELILLEDPPPIPAGNTKRKIALPFLVLFLIAAGIAFHFYEQANAYSSRYSEEHQTRLEKEVLLDTTEQELKEVQTKLKTTQTELETIQAELTSTQQKSSDAQKQLSKRAEAAEERAEAAEKEMSSLLSKLKGGYGFGSRNYYAEKGVVVLSKSGGSQSVGIISTNTNRLSCRSSDDGISCKWGDFFDNHRIPITITPVSTGYHTISFTNKANSDSFDILVIVTD